jgi:hypothetical protein
LSVLAITVLLILGVVLFRRHKGKQSWEENISTLDMGAPMGASSDVQTRLLLEIGPLFARQLFD